jgi:hypothetical protein
MMLVLFANILAENERKINLKKYENKETKILKCALTCYPYRAHTFCIRILLLFLFSCFFNCAATPLI